MSMDGLLVKLLESYGLSAKNIKRTKGYYIINVGAETFALRKSSERAESLEFRCRVQKKLLDGGFKNIERLHLTVDGKPFVQRDDQRFILTDYVSGTDVNFEDKGDLAMLLAALSDFHDKSKGINDAPAEFLSEHLPTRLRKMGLQLKDFAKRAKGSKNLSEFDMIFLKYYEDYDKCISLALKILTGTKYDHKLAEAHNIGSICHNLLKKDTVTIKGGEIMFTSLSNCMVDHFTTDIVMVLSKYMKYDPQRRIPIMEIIDMYTTNRPQRDDYAIILARLLMPTAFLCAAAEYYVKKRSWVPSQVTGELMYEVDSREAFFEYIAPLCSYVGATSEADFNLFPLYRKT